MSATIPKGILGYIWCKLKQISYSKESIEVNVELERGCKPNCLSPVCNRKALPGRKKESTVKSRSFRYLVLAVSGEVC
ncbi:MAG: hypothetical protein CO106_01705 [Deltaproteobacteria bacterium CG_4_9_14_3_um_filter_44_9]|nr:MAG: hypothetical protein AUK23_05545 [Deltaproteobacteria bacterium CG2_30_43_15]PIU84812.1 MAG: hypothetical protein COS67_11280 [Deltaproteobacteria bacterium CG06_land_8_20_14_3_00_44_19]PIX22872.1 MAG: hypothetical protein COZ68_10965 [Deltaproteobacteria bacterium CG_4_8_14_3_um_filter_43_13]PIZ18417.1 MAG: hypothetical protein COY50_15485 [Deltaproteobacteria bacterium CG_4_10_14_0_8_um_filter_43_12]PJB45483.1 MAG: hypothetical protein CO106_01705 [Deltaproteobacteria bacterium CG_4_9